MSSSSEKNDYLEEKGGGYKKIKMEKLSLITLFKKCLNILRDNEGITGEKALRNMSYLFVLKLLEPKIGDLKLDAYDFDFSHIIGDEEEYKNSLLKTLKFSNLSEVEEIRLPDVLKNMWEDILSRHPTTSKIFLPESGFDIKHQNTFKKIIDSLNSIELLSTTEYDVLGNAYEEVVKDIMSTGKVLGQFFTPPTVKKLMINLIDPKIKEDGTVESCGDPTMGTGGFLITYLKYIMEKSKKDNIKLDWDSVQNSLYGKELNPETYQLAMSNMLISSGHVFENLERGDSIRDPITKKFDNILANPPFGIKGLKYEEFTSSLKNEYLPIKSDNAVSLFIQAIIYMLKINGKCAVVLPYGQDLFSKSNTNLVSIREYLMKTCDLKEIIHLPSGVFTYTSIKTCIFFFVKKVEGSESLEIFDKPLNTRSQKSQRSYKFSETHQTSIVKFYNYNLEGDIKKLLIEVPIEKIVENSYSLNYSEYLSEKREKYKRGVDLKTLGEICVFLPKNKRNAKYGEDEGLYPFFKSSSKINKYVNEPDYTQESLIIGDGGEPNVNYAVNFSASDHCYILQNKISSVSLKYCYYYLFHNLNIMKNLYTGIAIKNISKSSIENIQIPIPSLEIQQHIVKYLDFIYENSIKTSQEKIQQLKKANDLYLKNQQIFGDNEVKNLGEVCEFKGGKGLTKKNFTKGSYPVIGGGKKPVGFHSEYNREENTILCSSSGAGAGYISRYPHKLWASDCFSIHPENKKLNKDYLFIFLKSVQNKILELQSGAAQPHIYPKDLDGILIPIPSLEIQKEIVDYLDYNETLILQLEKEIDLNKRQASLLIESIVKTRKEKIPIEEEEKPEEKLQHEEKRKVLKQNIPSVVYTKESLDLLNITKLKNIAKDLKIARYSTYKISDKSVLIDLILKA